jgi:unsaturated rhamnogalacturonyl hydrolase
VQKRSSSSKDARDGFVMEWGHYLMKTASPRSLAIAAFRKHREVFSNYDHYAGIVSLHGMARLAGESGDGALIDEIRGQVLPFVRGERQFAVNFPNYLCGGNAAAYLLWKGLLPEAEAAVRCYAQQILNDAPRDGDGVLSHPRFPGENRIWIDVAFTVTPFLLYAGRALNEPSYIDEAFQQVAKMIRVFRDPANGLLHQSRGFNGPGMLSEDHWSRGNGWGAYALTELACSLPAGHPHREEAVRFYRDHVAACANVQDEAGLWHQEMTVERSYVETSGSGLLLYALGAGIQAGILPSGKRDAFAKGLAGLLAYISADLDIYHTCRGCLCPGKGTPMDYMAHSPNVNDVHSFGPVVLAMGQAALMGIAQVGHL